MKIAVMAAMDEEFEAFEKLMTDVELLSPKPYLLKKGLVGRTEVYLLRTLMFKTYAAITATKFLENYDVDLVVNIGTEGSLRRDVHVNDVVVVTKVAYHDINDKYFMGEKGWNTVEEEPGAPYGTYMCDPRCVEVASHMKTEIPFHVGPMVSGDAFIDIPCAEEILKHFPEALCGENEAGGIAQTCTFYHVPFIVLRAISDITVEHDNINTFKSNVYSTSDVSAMFARQFIEELDKN